MRKRSKNRQMGIYRIINIITDEPYVGQTDDWERREKEHRKNHSSNDHLQNAIKKFGIENFKFELYERLEWIEDRNERIRVLNGREQHYLDLWQPFVWLGKGYNVSPTAGGNNTGCKRSEESKERYKQSKLGDKNPFFQKQHSQEHIEMLSNLFSNEGNPNAKINFEIAKQIRNDFSQHILTEKELGQKYNLHKSTISYIIQNHLWEDPNYVPPSKKVMPTSSKLHLSKIRIEKGLSKGDKNPNATITWEIVNKIRSDWETGNFRQADLCRKYNLKPDRICDIVHFKTWKV